MERSGPIVMRRLGLAVLALILASPLAAAERQVVLVVNADGPVGQLDPPHVLRTLNGPAHLDPLFPADTTAIAATSHRRQMADSGQATTEYALVMLGAAAVALLVITWATAGGGAGRIGRLFDHVIDSVVSRI